jgi:hypothetical protein
MKNLTCDHDIAFFFHSVKGQIAFCKNGKNHIKLTTPTTSTSILVLLRWQQGGKKAAKFAETPFIISRLRTQQQQLQKRKQSQRSRKSQKEHKRQMTVVQY